MPPSDKGKLLVRCSNDIVDLRSNLRDQQELYSRMDLSTERVRSRLIVPVKD